jgi:hypothetical protein
MNNKSTFFLLYFRQLSKSDTYEKAYEAAENEYIAQNGKRKYKNYACFKTILSRYQKLK